MGQQLQAGTRGAADSFSKFVEGDDRSDRPRAGPESEKRDFWDSFGADPKGPPSEKKDFWDSFGGAGDSPQKSKPTSIGTSAMKKPGGAGKKDEDWGEW